jgi:hypothetical protein
MIENLARRRDRRRAPGAPCGAARVLRLLLLALAAITLLAPLPLPAGGEEELRQQVEREAQLNALLRQQLELASGEQFYLLYDPPARLLRLMLRGVVLQEFPVADLEVGTPRVLFARRPTADSLWRGRIWTGGRLDPPRNQDRLEIQVPESEEVAVEPTIPPTVEEAYPVPERYFIRFEGGLVIEVRQVGEEVAAEPPEPVFGAPEANVAPPEPGFWDRLRVLLRQRVEDARAAQRPREGETLRLRLHLPVTMAKILYRSFPPETKLLLAGRP